MRDLLVILGNPLWARIGFALSAFLWQGALAALLLACANAALAGRGPRARYAAACGALLFMLACPIATFLLQDPALASAAAPAQALRSESVSTPASAPAAESSATILIRTLRARTAELAPRLAPGWAAGVLLLSLRFFGGWTVARRMTRRRVLPVPAAVRDTLSRLSERLGVKPAVAVLQSAAVAVPTAIGTLRPMILLPFSALTGLSPEGLEAVLAHELAHIRRRDYLVNLLQIAVETLLFYHPAVWWVSRRIRIERENCCDDIAVEATGHVRAYARALVGLEQIRGELPRLTVAASGGTLLQRIARLLPSPSPADGASRGVAIALALTAVAAFGAASRVPALAASSEIAAVAVLAELPASESSPTPTLAGVHGGVKGGVAGGVPGGVRGAAAGGVSQHSPPPSPDAGRPLSPDELVELRRHGVTPAFLGALASLGYKQASLDDLIALKVHGVSPEFISTMTELFGKKLSLDELTSLRIHGVSPEFVRAFRAAGYPEISADSAQSLRIHGVTPEMGLEWTNLLGRPSLDELLSARIHGVLPDFGKEMKALGVESDLDSLVSMRLHGVTPAFVRAIKALGFSRLAADEATSLRVHGVTPEFAREVQSLGYKSVSLDDLTSLRIHGVTPEFIREANRSATPRLSIDELLDLRIHRRTK